jgi:hypothetical protein
MSVGDRVQLYDDERYDVVDADRVQTLLHDYLELLGAMFGVTQGGTLTLLLWDTTTLASIPVPEGLFFTGALSGAGGLAVGKVVRHDPTLPGQTSTINLSGQEPGTPYIWARRTEVDSDLESRRQWDGGAGDEVTFTPNTKKVERVVFGVGGTTPDGNSGWFKIARVVAWAASKPAIQNLHPFDWAWDGINGSNATVGLVWNTFGKVMGAGPLLAHLARSLAVIQDKSGGKRWDDLPARDLTELDADLAAVEGTVTGQETVLANANGNVMAATFAGVIEQTGTSTYGWSGGNIVSVTRVSEGELDIVFNGLLTAIFCTPKFNDNGANNPIEYDNVTVKVISRTYDGGTDQTTFKVQIAKNSDWFDQSFYVLAVGKGPQ